MRFAMIESGDHDVTDFHLSCQRSLRGYQSCSNYRYL